eukprot:2689680-Lingulodinium_polyedra.AAC.1
MAIRTAEENAVAAGWQYEEHVRREAMLARTMHSVMANVATVTDRLRSSLMHLEEHNAQTAEDREALALRR